ncbi:transglycosylase SLT domain-containing protein [Streptosporangium sp. NPDC006013]|uniref:aggregation-promoting factor C-terminal-like domain-containing protein n=1 Tax=Streptosporangium sp. NPDC006013 TaxID=3155596 RepID=UPI0033B2B06A
MSPGSQQLKDRSAAPRARRANRRTARTKAPGRLTPKRVLILGTAVVVVVGGGAFTAYTAVQNASAPPTQPLTLEEMAQVLGSDPFGSDLGSDMLKAQAAQALKADKIAAERDNRKVLNPVKIVDEAPGGGGFNPQRLPPGTANPTGNRALGKQMLESRGWADQWGCLEKLWMKESGWNERAMNTSSGAYGIPQSLPGHKMASSGSDWQTNPATQIEWGLTYIKGRYGTPCGAWAHSQAKGWY